MTLRNLIRISGVLFALSASLSAQQDEFIFTPLIVDEESSSTISASALAKEELTFNSLLVKTVEKPVPNPEPAGEATQPLQVAEPVKRLRDPFWPQGYVPEEWKIVSENEGEDAADWGSAAKKLRVNYTRVVEGRRVASINGVLKSAGDTVEVISNGYRFQWKLVDIYDTGRLKLKKLTAKNIK